MCLLLVFHKTYILFVFFLLWDTALRYTEWLVIYLLSIENDCVLEF